MKPFFRSIFFLSLFLMLLPSTAFRLREPGPLPFQMPFRKAGLDERQAAALLLDKFTYGTRPGAIEEILQTGHEQWFLQQLQGQLNDTALNRRLSGFDALALSNAEVAKRFPRPATVLREMQQAGIIQMGDTGRADRASYRRKLREFMLQKGYRPRRELYNQHISRKILSATYSRNQLHQLLTDFWFNHFNVSITKNACAEYVPAYERDVIRPRVAGRFYDLLLATAQSPAMLLYLDNFNSTASIDSTSKLGGRLLRRMEERIPDTSDSKRTRAAEAIGNRIRNRGLNENYAREIMELHTLGVDGGYTQQDVTQAARILTGWTVYPFDENGRIRKLIDRIGEDRLEARGFVRNGDFLFAATLHDQEEKKVLGTRFPAGGGYEEGVRLLQLLAGHPSTARFISRKLAVRFLSDEPPTALVDDMASAFSQSGGDMAVVLKTMVSSLAFWTEAAKNQKTKSPFELAISSVRALDADIRSANDLNRWIGKMGQPLYAYQAPTGYPDRGQFWINTGSIINRMNFGLSLCSGKIEEVKLDLPALNRHREPESAADALRVYCGLLLPGRNPEPTIGRLTPLLQEPGLEQKLAAAALKAGKEKAVQQADMDAEEDAHDDLSGTQKADGSLKKEAMAYDGEATLAQVTGILIGSPEFQRR
jgi:uncharacterized protein (DUF1800 family)